ncbi:MAG: sugar ABC transporter ATP-binding protein [Spirochaetia bacterium]
MSLLTVHEVSRSFPGTLALDRVSFTLEKEGEIHAMVGENGAGKSTLVKIINGALPMSSGGMFLRGELYHPMDVLHAQRLHLGFIPQTSNLIGCLSVKENLFLGHEHVTGRVLRRVDWERTTEEARRLLEKVKMSHVNLNQRVEEFRVAERQLFEIAKVLGMHARIITMDESTSSLTEEETDRLFGIIRSLKAEGVSVIFVSHKLDEIFEISEKITVLRNGQCVGTRLTTETTRDEIVHMMTGREDLARPTAKGKSGGAVALKANGITTHGIVHDVSFDLAAGETLAVAGLLGSGQTELMEALCGFRPPRAGSVEVGTKKVRLRSPGDALRNGIAYIPEDRHAKGLMLNLPLLDNVCSASMRSDRRHGFISGQLQAQRVQLLIQQLNIACSGKMQLVESLSGGNQQKVLIARCLKANPRILLLNEPTRGIDVGAKAEIYRLIADFKENGGAVLMVSTELPEILAESDRIMVMHEGRVTGFFFTEEATKQKLMYAMTA